ncbi:MAG: hypothetical protein IJS28_08140 [Synergistaceae bacterium]|nr:hypothetical protein [Synergistaceae bacterium]
MQVTSMLSAGYLEPMMQGVSRAYETEKTAQKTDQDKQAKEQEILAEEQALRAKLGSNAQVHTVYHYSMGTDGRNYITGASVTMKGTEEELNRVSGGVTTEDITAKEQETREALLKEDEEHEDSQNIIKAEADKREARKKEDKSEDEKEAQVRELEQTQREVIAHEAAHQAAAGQFGGGVSYTYTEGPDGKRYITGGEVPIKLKQGSTPEETLRNMQQVQRAANAPADPSGQDRQVAAKAAALAAKARGQIAREDDTDEEHLETVAEGTPIFAAVNKDDEQQDPAKNGVSSVLAAVKEYELQGLMSAA